MQHLDPIELEDSAVYSLASDGLLFFGNTRTKAIVFLVSRIAVMLLLPNVRMCGEFKWDQPIGLEIMQRIYLTHHTSPFAVSPTQPTTPAV